MTKARARERAKARAAAKTGKTVAVKSGVAEKRARSGQIASKTNSMRDIGRGADIKSTAAMRRGAARSR